MIDPIPYETPAQRMLDQAERPIDAADVAKYAQPKERPILFSAPMVLALLAGTKTQTRRVLKPQPDFVSNDGTPGRITKEDHRLGRLGKAMFCPYGVPGDRLWVRETYYAWGHWTKRRAEKKRREEWHFVDETVGAGLAYRYEADEQLPRRKRVLHEVGWWKRPAIFMPRAASRIAPEITAVRVERLQEISEADAHAEGSPCIDGTFKLGYRRLWESINGAGSWDANRWVWVIEFRRIP